jgi:hypothetical protein
MSICEQKGTIKMFDLQVCRSKEMFSPTDRKVLCCYPYDHLSVEKEDNMKIAKTEVDKE